MKRVLFLVVLVSVFLLAANSAYASTYVSGTINENTTWTTTGSPYILVGKVTVAQGVTLTVEGGVEIRPLIPRFQSHQTHFDTEGKGPGINDCSVCHANPSPVDFNKCNNCHSPNGAFDGVNDPDVGAKNNFDEGVYEEDGKTLKIGKEKWCVTCHDDQPAVVGSQTAPNKAGDNSTYGYYINGHGKSDNYSRMGWQDILGIGNPGANQLCTGCHDTAKKHINETISNIRLKDGYENDQDNTNCSNCHKAGGIATADPQFYTNSADFENSVHKNKLCSECHDVHGATGAYTAMTKANKENLCNQCHGPSHAGHALGNQFTNSTNGKIYNLACTSCHNVHIISGVPTEANPNKSPVTKLSDITQVWGDSPAEKITAYASAGGGVYRTPNGDSLSGNALPDYDSFCPDCHGGLYTVGIQGQDSHFYRTAGAPSGGNHAPDQYSFGKGEGWDGDDITDPSKAWPVIPRGRGEQNWTREPFNQEERIAGINFVLSCTDCHVVHESGIGKKIRSTINGNPGSTNWNTTCNACHWYYNVDFLGADNGHSYRVAGQGMKGCGSASCHETNSIHQAKKLSYPWGVLEGIRIFNPDLVADMRFDNNLNDSGSFRLNGRWTGDPAWSGWNGVGSYVAGKYGSAIEINDDPVEIGTRNIQWSNDESAWSGTTNWGHGTWKYSEMKYNTTLEAWVYPTDNSANEKIIMTKHNNPNPAGEDGGGYQFLLRKVAGTYRAALKVNVNGGGTYGVQDSDSNGWRGAFSTTGIPLNKWTHIAATFDTNGPDKNLSDLSVGRVRIYVNGEDVTTSYPSNTQIYSQPAFGETYIYPYSQHSIVGDSITKTNPWGYDGHWTGTVLSIGGYNWSDTGKNFIGRLDEAKIWNITKEPSYFGSADQASAPRIDRVEGVYGSNQLTVTFSEGVYTNTGQSGALIASNFVFADADNGRTITDVTHTAGSSTATLTLSSALDETNDINTDTLAAVSSQIYDNYNNAAETDPVTLTMISVAPNEAYFELNEASGGSWVYDTAGLLSGKTYGSGTLTGSSFYGNNSSNYIDFAYSDTALQADIAMTLEARIKPTGLTGTGAYIKRIFARGTSDANYQMSVWRAVDAINWPNYTPVSGEASIALWVRVNDAHGGVNWKPVLTEATNSGSSEYHPIVTDHWYKVKVVWNTNKTGGVSGQPFVPANIYLDDQGTDGNGAGERWSGYVDATDADQSQISANRKLYTGDTIKMADGGFRIGANTPSSSNYFYGWIDYVYWKKAID
ncbi:MAG: hypothetical protein HY776_08355 [Actinobacteria bacterium]|nr:hypothetical protein [Actinomycetota bacterium]